MRSTPGRRVTHEQDEILFVVEGEITLIAGSTKATKKAGSLAYIPAHCVFIAFGLDIDKTRLLNFYFPGGFEKIITQFGIPATSLTLPPAGLPVLETPDQMKALLQRIGMTMVALPDVLRNAK